MDDALPFDPLIACDALLGPPRAPIEGITPDVEDLLSEMRRLHIGRTVVRHRACLEAGPYIGNDILMDEAAGREELLPAWFITPDGREPGFRPEAVATDMLSAGVRLAWTDPGAGGFSLHPLCAGSMLRALERHRIPLILSYDAVSAGDLCAVLPAFPALRLILHDVPRLGRNRIIEPLLERFDHLVLCMAPSFSAHAAYRNLVDRYGPRRFVWGAGYPTSEGGAGVTGLTYAGLTGEEMGAIAHGNLERMLREVR